MFVTFFLKKSKNRWKIDSRVDPRLGMCRLDVFRLLFSKISWRTMVDHQMMKFSKFVHFISVLCYFEDFSAQNGFILAYGTSLRSKKYFSEMVEIQHGYRPTLVIHMFWTSFHYGLGGLEGQKGKIAQNLQVSLFPTTSSPWIINRS